MPLQISTRPLSGEDIHAKLKNVPCYQGTFAKNKLPEVKSLPAAFVINTDDDDQPGTHWIGIFIDRDRNGMYFDSFGLAPLYKEFINFLNKSTHGWCYNAVTLQHFSSSTCGLYCIFFIKALCKGIDISIFQRCFLCNPRLNDVIIQNYTE